MNSHQQCVLSGLALAMVMLCVAPLAAAQTLDEAAIDPAGVQLHPQEQNGISYLKGGIGIDESQAMQQIRGYNLQITLSSGPDNKYQSGAEVRIESAGGQPVLTLSDVGPMLYTKLPNGHYQVLASLNGEQQRQQVVIDGSTPVKLNLHWRE
ncbi:carboxypeptidase regulatory-like domain-containing protein [Pseudomonas sp. JQ170]|uniref:carboxypeptidase regulatory-like domain-containing protein n=1 Tax=unclassified Pseudomonas TaxID=196821 RepID=UPI0026559BD8|nr:MULTISPECIES: carboxypeptidase regulatory-like domain-containing protein [unclassified Pseudomonas]MDN7143444.1 carboxypeptidase regulatory-like domain-containing protein [Pseudomonas sp. JQ170]WRO73915.1 carboxypeptidase regulatory-like domain-containing protein [Pseudomonas sp. 170C]